MVLQKIGYCLASVGIAALITAGTSIYVQNSLERIVSEEYPVEIKITEHQEAIIIPTATAYTPPTRVPNKATSPIEAPYTLEIPKIKVSAQIEKVGKRGSWIMDLPSGPWTVSWYGVNPGEKGNAVIAGHLNYRSGPAVFGSLHLLTHGDSIYVKPENGKELEFRVDSVEKYYVREAPIERIFGTTASRNLNLFTCAGLFDKAKQDYDQRLFVYSSLVE